MTAFFWSSGHIGWGLFATLAISGLWLLSLDLVWRLCNISIRRLLLWMGGVWVLGIAIILVSALGCT